MTSPAQLKYLDAIGIPVWVSRDRIQTIDINADQVSEDGVQKIGSLEEIMNDLEEKSSKASARDFNLETIKDKSNLNTSIKPNITSGTESQRLPNEIGRTEQHMVFATGNLNADWMIIGESPELNEPHISQPFTGDSQTLIDQMLQSVGVESPRLNGHIINVIKHSFSSSETHSSELNTLLTETILKVSPKIVIIVGQISAQNLLQSKEPLARLRLKQHTIPKIEIPAIVTYYPTYLLSKPLDKRKAWEDLKLAMSIVKSSKE